MARWLLILAAVLSPVSGLAKEITVAVHGMVCSFCAQGIQKKLKKEPAVAKVEVILKKGQVKIETQPGQDLADEKIRAILSDAGYKADKIERK
jgi:periplasmic mercuric ion binding protein